MNSVELIEKKSSLVAEVTAMTAKARSEIRMLTEDENTRLDSIEKEIKQINEELRQLDVELPEEIENKLENTKKMSKEIRFSLVKAIRNAAANRQQDELTQAVIDAGQEEMRGAQVTYTGQIQLPSEYRTVTKAVEGADVVATDVFDVAQAISNHSVFSELGCRIIDGLTGDVQFPVISEANATWEAETATTAATTPTFSSVKLSPKRLSCVVPISKMLLSQDSAGVEKAIRTEIVKAVMGKLEGTVFGTGAGSATQPAGIFNGTISNTIAAFSDITALEATLDGKDGLEEKKYVMAPNVKAALRTMIKGTNGTGMVMENGEVDGTKAAVTGFVANDKLAYGDWSNLVIGMWNGLDLTVDNYTLAADGCIRLVINFYCDAQLVRSNAIAVATI